VFAIDVALFVAIIADMVLKPFCDIGQLVAVPGRSVSWRGGDPAGDEAG
jgi:hypothetical protein